MGLSPLYSLHFLNFYHNNGSHKNPKVIWGMGNKSKVILKLEKRKKDKNTKPSNAIKTNIGEFNMKKLRFLKFHTD